MSKIRCRCTLDCEILKIANLTGTVGLLPIERQKSLIFIQKIAYLEARFVVAVLVAIQLFLPNKQFFDFVI